MAFYGLLLCNVLFLTQVWGYDALEAGLALTPAPLAAAIAAPIGGKLSDRHGERIVAVPGIVLFALGAGLYAVLADATPNWTTEFLPGALVGGVGVGLTFAALGSAAVAELPPARYATGSAVSVCARQIGAVLGISVLVAVLGTPGPSEAVAAFRESWLLVAVAGVVAAVIAVQLGRRVVEAEATGLRPLATATSAPAGTPPAS